MNKEQPDAFSAGEPKQASVVVQDPHDKDSGMHVEDNNGWNDKIKQMGLDPSVEESHNTFVDGMDGNFSTTSSHMSVKDDFTPPVPWVGLPRRALYSVMGASSDARQIQSETPDQALEYAVHHTRGYQF